MSISQSTIKFIISLQRKKVRQNYHKFTAEGTKIVGEMLLQKRYSILELYANQEWYNANAVNIGDYLSSKALGKSVEDREHLDQFYPSYWMQQPDLFLVTDQELKKISALTTPNQIVAVAAKPDADKLATSLAKVKDGWSIYLDGLQQPANLGAILRVADWFGFQQIIAGPGTVDLFNQKSIQATMGCFLRLDYVESDLMTIQRSYPEIPIYAADLSGRNIYEFQAPELGILVIGNEGNGISASTRALISGYLMIPKGEGRQAESLNAAVAAGVLCSWLKK